MPGTLVIDDGLAMLVSIHDGLTGSGVNTSAYVTPFAHGWSNLVHWPLQQFLVLFALAAVAAVVGVRRRELGPALWFIGAAAAAFFAAARLGTRHYWAPALVLSVPAALWLCRQVGLFGAVGAAALVLYVFVPAGAHVRDGEHRASNQARASEVWIATADRLLHRGEIALAPPYVAPVEDVPYLDLVGLWVESPPARTYRFVSSREQGLVVAAAQHAKLAYYFGPRALAVRHAQTVELIPGHRYAVEPVLAERRPDVGLGVLRLVHGEGVDRPYGHPLARYDPWTGFYKQGRHYFDLYGTEAQRAPTRRRFLPREHLWQGANGDLWNARGVRVKSKPSSPP